MIIHSSIPLTNCNELNLIASGEPVNPAGNKTGRTKLARSRDKYTQDSFIIFRMILLSCSLFLANFSFAQQILNKHLSATVLTKLVDNIDDWRLKKRAEWLQDIQQLPDTEKIRMVKKAEQANAFTWPSLLATKYLEYKTDGNRTRYEEDVNKRRTIVAQLVIGELVERKGRFIPQIANGLWLLLEESTWVSPAHIVVQKSGIGLPDPTDEYIDLGAGRVAADLAAIYLLLGDDLDQISPLISKKLKLALRDRIVNPYLERDDFWWMALRPNNTINNWNIWINTNVLKVALLVEEDPLKLNKILRKLITSSDKFIDAYAEDGACEEGPSYWLHAGGELGQLLSWFEDLSHGQVSFKDEQKLFNIGNYILNSHVHGDRYINFADAEAIQIPYPAKVWTYGTLFQNENLKAYASYLAALKSPAISLGTVQDFLMHVPIYDQLMKHSLHFTADQFHFYPSLGQATMRSRHKNGNLFLATIGSNNGVSHNHNDVGSYMLYLDSLPVLIDVGVGTYTKETFSANRYALWNMQSQWHNLPIINGVQEKDGKAYHAEHVSFEVKNKSVNYGVDIAKAYPKEAAVISWKRNLSMNPQKNEIQVDEVYQLQEFKTAQTISFMSMTKPIIGKDQFLLGLTNGKKVTIAFDKNTVDLSYEEKQLEDPRLVKVWGNTLYRTKVRLKNEALKNQLTYKIVAN
ncbi:heparinase II/III-family protein [Sphingobacterium sp. SRCM116780]|uniref:heparinase II/III domain-containing protein n=1 Tax=Sphingobacterium sp. SRCM116780 TaxID=2907623 RepID=UPI001F3D3E0F|nr:heparinase II/III family protein [Sphingobacterium sp. SRCM116780]UIR55464.1 heparinase II/III-family protein [Sphingobacterium sp. SRCM116780]